MSKNKVKEKDRMVSKSYSMTEAEHHAYWVIGNENRSKASRRMLQYFLKEIPRSQVQG